MEQDLHHPSPRLPEGWKRFQADNIDVTTIADLPALTGGGHFSRSASAHSNHSGFINTNIIQPSQMQNVRNSLGDSIYGEEAGGGGGELIGMDQNTTQQYEQQQPDLSHFRHSSVEEYDYNANTQTRHSIGGSSPRNNYFHLASTAPMSTATGAGSHTFNQNNSANNSNTTTNTNTRDDPSFYDPSSSPFINPNPFAGSTTSPPLVQDTLSPFAPYHNSFDAAQHQQQATFEQYDVQNNNTLGPPYSHYRSVSEQSEISSNAPSPYLQSIHSEQGSPFITAQGDHIFEEDLLQGFEELDMGAPFDPVVTQYQTNHQTYDTTNLPLDQGGFPIDAPLFPSSSDRQEQQQYYDQQQPSRPTSSHSYTHPTFPESIFAQPSNISTSIPPAFTSPPLPSATSIPEIEVTVAPPTPGTQAYFEYYPYSRQYQQQSSGSAHNSPSIQPSYLSNTQDLAPLSLAATGRRRAVSDSGARPTFGSMMPPSSNTTLVRRVSSGSHPYLGIHEGNGSSSGRSTPSRGYHRKSYSHGGHNMTAREVLELVKNEGPREAKNPKKFVCDYPGCGQRFTRNSNKTYLSTPRKSLILVPIC